jgi:chorismate mutase-like protein
MGNLSREAALKVLAEHRDRIDVLDRRLLLLLNERTRVVEEIGKVKREANMPIYEPKREDAVFQNVTEHNEGPLRADAIKRIFERIVDEMRIVQRLRMERDGEPKC